jgi:hypothetical protein
MCHKKYPFLLRNVVLSLLIFKKEVYYPKLWRRNDTKIYENKIYSCDKNRLRLRTRMVSRIPATNISRKLDTRHLCRSVLDLP